jgi:O-antigen biosynthesis protein WbqV
MDNAPKTEKSERMAVSASASGQFGAIRFGRAAPRSTRKSLRRRLRLFILINLDFLAIMTSLLIAIALIFSPALTLEMMEPRGLLLFGLIGISVLAATGLHFMNWRFFGFGHAMRLVAASTVAMALAWAAFLTYHGKGPGLGLLATGILQWLLCLAFMTALRSLRRAVRERFGFKARTLPSAQGSTEAGTKRALLVGSPQWALSTIELTRAEVAPSFEVAGILLPSLSDPIDRIGGVKVLGSHDMLSEAVAQLADRGRRPDLVIANDDSMHLSPRELAKLSHRARELGLELSKVRDCWSQILLRGSSSAPQEFDVTSLLGRDEYKTDKNMVARQVEGQCVLTTGAGGTIGSELCRQLAQLKPSRLVLVEQNEFNLYTIENDLRERFPDLDIRPEICNIRDASEVRRIFAENKPSIVYHAAALKHVPIVEANSCAGVHTNILGTKVVADAVCEFGARAMVQVSTDKAVNPVGLMGATKRVGELYCQALDVCGVDDVNAPRFMTVRFGNVLGSSGSILPLFKRQLEEGKPLTVTHPDIERFFMTVTEAVQLILQSSSSALDTDSERGTIFVLDMGKPVRILDLAYRLIALYGLDPEIDVPIEFVGLRPGEKLYEELFDNCEVQVPSRVEGIFEARSQPIPLPFIKKSIERLADAVRRGDDAEAARISHHLVRIPSSGVQFSLDGPGIMSGIRKPIDRVPS